MQMIRCRGVADAFKLKTYHDGILSFGSLPGALNYSVPV